MPAITSIATANPDYKQSQSIAAEVIAEVLCKTAAEERLVKSIYQATGIQHRYSVLSDFCKKPGEFTLLPNPPNSNYPTTKERMKVYKDNALPLSLKAIKQCLASIDFDKSQITHIVTVSCTGMYAPGLDIEIIHHLGLETKIQRTAINFMGCYGAFNGIKVANDICKANANANVLVICIELCSLHFQAKLSVDYIISNAIFADGAGCVLIQSKPSQKKYFSLDHFYCDLLPQTSNEMAWHVADHGFEMILTSYVPQAIKSGIKIFLDKLIDHSKKDLSIDYYAIHPGGLKILQACEEALTITKEQLQHSYHVLQNYGNMSSVTMLFVLKSIWDSINAKTDNNKNIFSCAFGPGLTLESMMLSTSIG